MIYVVHKNGNEDYVCTTDTKDFHSELSFFGATILNESEFQKILEEKKLNETDSVMVHVGLAHVATKMGLKHFSGNKVLFTIDESKSDGVLFRTHQEFCKETDIKKIILSYPSERNVNFLKENGYETISYNPSNTVRERKEKKYDIIISGQINKEYYPVRTLLAEILLKNKRRWNVVHLPHPGFEISKAAHQYTGEKYRELLDECKFGIVCRAGWRDRLVAKYIEYGASWCLPIGDHPTYMESELKKSMIFVDESFSENEIVTKIDLAFEQYEENICKYVNGLKKFHDLKSNVKKLLTEISK